MASKKPEEPDLPPDLRELKSVRLEDIPPFDELPRVTKSFTQILLENPHLKGTLFEQLAYEEQMNATKAKHAAMTEDELLDALLLNELTGLKGRRSLEVEIEFAKHVVAIEADWFDWVNDNISKEAGEDLLREVADALRDEFGPDYSYNLYDEKFYVLSDGCWTPEQLEEGMLQVRTNLASATAGGTAPDGRDVFMKGLDVTWAVGDSKDEADANVVAERKARQPRAEPTLKERIVEEFQGTMREFLQSLPPGGKLKVTMPPRVTGTPVRLQIKDDD